MVAEYVTKLPDLNMIAGVFVGFYLILRLYLLVRDIGRLDPAE